MKKYAFVLISIIIVSLFVSCDRRPPVEDLPETKSYLINTETMLEYIPTDIYNKDNTSIWYGQQRHDSWPFVLKNLYVSPKDSVPVVDLWLQGGAEYGDKNCDIHVILQSPDEEKFVCTFDYLFYYASVDKTDNVHGEYHLVTTNPLNLPASIEMCRAEDNKVVALLKKQEGLVYFVNPDGDVFSFILAQ